MINVIHGIILDKKNNRKYYAISAHNLNQNVFVYDRDGFIMIEFELDENKEFFINEYDKRNEEIELIKNFVELGEKHESVN